MKTVKILILLSVFFWGLFGFAPSFKVEPTVTATPSEKNLPNLPIEFPKVEEQDRAVIVETKEGLKKELTVIPYIQSRLDKFIEANGSPVAGVVLADVKTGNIMAMSQGLNPKQWGGAYHTALHARFPAASLFKMVVAAAAFEVAAVKPEEALGLQGGCGDVLPTGIWLSNQVSPGKNPMTLRRAFGHSCNGFFAKLAVNYLGLGTITDFARKFGWGGNVDTDFAIEKSPFTAPSVETSSVHSIGRFAAGFGSVGISPTHAAWLGVALANNGIPKKLRLFKADQSEASQAPEPLQERILGAEAASELRGIMDATVQSGTATFAFRRGKYRELREVVGGKTGTLNGNFPKGVVTWFTGMMPIQNPEVVVAAVVVLENLWHIKAPNLAAEALWSYQELKKNSLTASLPATESTN